MFLFNFFKENQMAIFQIITGSELWVKNIDFCEVNQNQWTASSLL